MANGSDKSDEAPPSKSGWDHMITSTPIVMSVLSTLLAGLSTNEMNLAQYHRILAAQAQSKAGDQWGFFQAKRVRGTSLEMTVDLLQTLSSPDRFDAASFQTAADRLVTGLHRAEDETDRLVKAVELARSQLHDHGARLLREAEQLRKSASDAARAAVAEKARVLATTKRKDVQEACVYLGGDRLPPVREIDVTDDGVRQALGTVTGRRPDGEVLAHVHDLDRATLSGCLADAEGCAREFEEAGEKPNRVFTDLDRLVQNEVLLTRPYYRAARDFAATLADVPNGSTQIAEMQAAALGVLRNADMVHSATTEFYRDFKAARHDYTARRYKREAHDNLVLAGLYELQVKKNSLMAERHRERSKNFFYGMLGSQAAVTIASLSLAVRRRSVFWGLAATAGIGALLFAVYVYVFL